MYGLIDELQDLRKERDELADKFRKFKEVVWSFIDFTPHCGDENRCYTCGAQWYPNKCKDTCLAKIMFRVTKEVDSSSTVWLELTDDLDEVRSLLEDTRKALKHTGSWCPCNPNCNECKKARNLLIEWEKNING